MFATLWVIGLISFVVLAGMLINNFRARAHSEEEFALTQPSHGSLIIRTHANVQRDYYDDDWWFGNGWRHNGFFYSLSDDSLLLNTVQIKVLRSDDSSYHVRILRGSLGSSTTVALDYARQISFPVTQSDSVIQLPGGFPITRDQQFRNQQVIVVVYIPVGKKIMMDNSVKRYDWVNLHVGRGHINWENDDRYDENYDDEGFSLENNYYWNSGVQYIMTTDGLQRVSAVGRYEGRPEQPERRERPELKEKPELREKPEAPEKSDQPAGGGYRYKEPAQKRNADTPVRKTSTWISRPHPSPFVLLSSFFI
jgi:uncharacterized protein YraI